MSGTQVSAWQTPNELLTSMQTPALVLHNQLANQGAQQELNAAEMEQLSRASNWVISQDPENKDPAKQAQAYSTAVGILQKNGYAKNAPSEYPGFDHMQLFARMGTPSQTQAEWQQNIAANKAISNATGMPGQGAAAPPGGGGGSAAPAAAPNAGGATIGQRQNNPGNLSFAGQPYASPGQGNRFASFPDMATGVAANADQLGLYQTQHGINTVRGAVTRWVSDPKADLTSYIADVSKAIGVGPDDKIDLTDPVVQQKFIQAQFPHESAGGGYVLNPADVQKGVQMAAARRGQQVQPTPQVATAASGGGTTPPPYRVAQAGPLTTPPPTASTVPLVSAPSAAAAAAPPAPATTTDPETQLPALSAPPNQMMPGQPNGPPAAAPPAVAPPAAQPPAAPARVAPAGGPQPPQLSSLNSHGLTALQQAQLDALGATGQLKASDRLKMEQTLAQQNIATQQKSFGDWIQLQQLQTSQGQLSVSQANSALEYWKAANPDAKVTLSGGEIITQDPRSGREIAPRIQVGPNAAPRTVEGPGVWDGQKWVQAQPGQQGTPGKWTIGPGGGQFFPSQDAILEEQKRDAARLADVRKDTLEQAQGAAQTSALIGNAEQAMTAAISGKIPPGHFGPELLRITAVAKSLGIDLSPFGVDEKALAAGQVTREQLQQMNGAILRKMFPQRVTNVDLATTGAALPNYGLDPEALTANFRIYRAQADYDQARARDMLDYEAQHGGSLVGWEHQWVQKHGFSNGPLDNLFSDAKSGNLGKGGTGAASNAPAYKEGDTATGKDGHKIIFHNGQWGPK